VMWLRKSVAIVVAPWVIRRSERQKWFFSEIRG
jgi:hypothetical protein